MILKCLRFLYNWKYNRILKLCNYEEFICPNLYRMDEYIRALKTNRREEYL